MRQQAWAWEGARPFLYYLVSGERSAHSDVLLHTHTAPVLGTSLCPPWMRNLGPGTLSSSPKASVTCGPHNSTQASRLLGQGLTHAWGSSETLSAGALCVMDPGLPFREGF